MKRELICSIAAIMVALCVGCARTKPEGFQVVSHDSSGKWIFIRTGTFDGKYIRTRITAVCELYKWGNREPLYGSNVCDLPVGRAIIPNRFPPEDKRNEFIDVWIMSSDTLVITEGDGDNMVSQHFGILKEEETTQ